MSRREPTWAYRYGRGKYQEDSEGSSSAALDSPLLPSALNNVPSLYNSLSVQPSSFRRDESGDTGTSTSFMSNYIGENAPSSSIYDKNVEIDTSGAPELFGSGFSERNIASIAGSSSPSKNSSVFNTVKKLLKGDRKNLTIGGLSKTIALALIIVSAVAFALIQDPNLDQSIDNVADAENDFRRPAFVYEHPYVSSSYYSSTASEKTLLSSEKRMQENKLLAAAGKGRRMNVKTRLAIVRPFCEFDAGALPSTFACWDALVPCKTALNDLGDLEQMANGDQNRSSWNTLAEASADLFLFYSQSFVDNPVALGAVDSIIDTFNSPGGWSQCFDNVYAIEANIPRELDLYIPSAQEELYNWVNGPNRQFEAAFRIIQSGEWGDYDAFYLMEGDSIPVKSHWLDQILFSAETHRPFAILGAKYNGDKWDNFYESIPLSLLHHINGNAIYNTSHPLLERLVGQLEIEAPCPYNSIPYDYRMSQMVTEGALKIVPKLAPKIMLNEEGENITLSENTNMFSRWWDMYKDQNPFKETYVIHNYAATNLIPRHLGPEYIIHGAKLYSPWDPTKTEVTLVISEWFSDRSMHLLSHLDHTDHPFSKVIVMLPPDIMAHDSYNMTVVPVVAHHRSTPDYMDLCEAPVETEYFMLTNSYHHVATHVDLMFTPGTFKPVTAFTPATYAFCFKFPYCKETVNLAQRFNPGHKKVVQDFDMLYNTKYRNDFCREWKDRWGSEGEDLYKNQKQRLLVRGKIIGPKGPTGTAYTAYLARDKLDAQYKFTDRSLYGARDAFVKIFAREEKQDSMSSEELAKRNGVTAFDNSTDCDCKAFETQSICENSPLGCVWRPLFESCRPPEMIDDGTPICPQSDAPTMSPTVFYEFEDTMNPTATPTRSANEPDPWYASLFRARERARNREPEEEGINVLSREDQGGEDEDEIEGDQSDREMLELNSTEDGSDGDDGTRRKLNLLDFESNIVQPIMDTPPSLSPVADLQNELFIASELGFDALNRSLNRELYFSNVDSEMDIGIQPSTYYLAPSTSPAKALEACPTWGPSIVKRVESKKRKKSPFQEHFFEENIPTKKLLSSASNAYFKRDESDITVASKMSQYVENPPARRTSGLIIPDIKYMKNKPLDGSYVRVTDYRDRHPFEGGGGAVSGFLEGYGSDDHPFDPIRIKFETSHLDEVISSVEDYDTNQRDKARVDTLLREILPSITGIYSEALKVVPVYGNLLPTSSKCGAATVPEAHIEDGVDHADLLVYVTSSKGLCSTLESRITACSFDQHMRPIVGNLEICLDAILLDENGSVSKEETLNQISHYTMEVGALLGLSPNLFQFFRDPETGRPYGTSSQSLTCVDGTKASVDLPNILNAEISPFDKKKSVYELISPTVLQIVKNHFDCQTMSGVPLDNHDSSWSCFGSHWDKRLFFDEDWILGSNNGHKSFSLTPLTLALLEDSSWYKADYEKSSSPAFGHGAGCGFVEDSCMRIDESLPSYAKGFFCNSESNIEKTGCDYTHEMKASCNSDKFKDDKESTDLPFMRAMSSELSDINLNSCPMMSKNLVSCTVEPGSVSHDFEKYGKDSKCFETNTHNSLCLEAFCNKKNKKVEFIISEQIYQCDYDGQEILIDTDVSIQCPRIAAICPDLVCPSSCSGRGICDYCLEVPQCICDDPFDDTPGCWGS